MRVIYRGYLLDCVIHNQVLAIKKSVVPQVEIYCDTKGLSIVGYYHANERLNDTTISDTAVTIANKIANNCDKACLLIVSHE